MSKSMIWNSITEEFKYIDELSEEERKEFWEEAQKKGLEAAGYRIVETGGDVA